MINDLSVPSASSRSRESSIVQSAIYCYKSITVCKSEANIYQMRQDSFSRAAKETRLMGNFVGSNAMNISFHDLLEHSTKLLNLDHKVSFAR